MNYEELKKNYQKQVDSLHFMIGLSKKWFEEVMRKKQNHEKVYQIGGGVFADEENYQKLNQFTKSFEDYIKQKIEQKDEEFVFGAIYYEMSNKEYPYSREDEEVLEPLGLSIDILGDERFKKQRDKAYKQLLSDYDW